ncbi:MAG: hypothetical protein AB9866_02630 [Syntrophobacteraceae bacterium]
MRSSNFRASTMLSIELQEQIIGKLRLEGLVNLPFFVQDRKVLDPVGEINLSSGHLGFLLHCNY